MNDSALGTCLQWLRRQWWAFLLCSLVLLVPCFWHRHVQACDLGSHIYNAWLSQLVAQGKLPGLSLETKYTNVLVDVLLTRTYAAIGATGAERAVSAFCVLIFFWGAFAFVSAAASRAAWHAVPLLAMVSYGAIFYWGFFNFYLSVGFSLLALALIVSGTLREWLVLPFLLALAASAHPLGAVSMIALGIYLALVRILAEQWQRLIFVFFLLLGIALRWYAVYHLTVLPRATPYYFLMGADQLIVFGRAYLVLAAIALSLVVAGVLLDGRSLLASPWFRFYVLIAVLVSIAPGGFFSDQHFGMMGYLQDRGSLYSSVALGLLIACGRRRVGMIAAWSALAVVFFGFLYRDTRVLERRTENIAKVLDQQKPARVLAFVAGVDDWRIHEDHSTERACIGRCYVINNYEPSTFQFRLQADPGNPVVEVDQDALDAMSDGSYVVQEKDLPLSEAYQCGARPEAVCLVELQAGQKNGDVPNVRRPQ